MGIDLLSWALGKSGKAWPKGPDRLMFMVLAEMAHDDDAFCWPGVELLRLRCNLEDRTSVERTINRLIIGGWVANDERYVARPGRPVDGQKRGYRILVPAEEWAPMEAKRAPKRSTKESRPEAALTESRFGAALVENAAPTQRNAAPEPKECRSDAIALRKEPYRTITEPTTPPSPLTGGASPSARVTQPERTALAGLQALKERLWSEQQRHVDRKIGRAIKSRLRAGESVESLWADYFELRPGVDWDPPAEDPSAKAMWKKILDQVKADDRVSAHSICTWLMPLRVIEYWHDHLALPGRVTVAAPTREFSRLCEQGYSEFITAAAHALDLTVHFWKPVRTSDTMEATEA